MRQWWRERKIFLILPLWITFVVLGTGYLLDYSNGEGEGVVSSASWPSESRLERREGRPIMIMFAHPHCPCSAASIGELERLMPFLIDRADVFVVFVRPPGRTPAWVQSDLWAKAERIPGVRPVVDDGYRETDLFGARTSGQTFLYDGFGAPVFWGGITPGRGHQGDSEGRNFILTWLRGENAGQRLSKVFGCALREGELLTSNRIDRKGEEP